MRSFHVTRSLTLLLGVLLTATACASSGPASGGGPRGTTNRIIESELEPHFQLSAYQAVQRLRSGWLVSRSGSDPQVHVDGNPQMGGLEALRSLRAEEIQEMEFLSAADATTRFGTNYVGGLIMVTTKRGRR